MPEPAPIQLDIVSDVVCPWCYIGKHRFEQGLEMLGHVGKFNVRWRPYELNPTMPVEGIDRRTYCEQKFGSLEYANQLYANVAANAEADGLPIEVAQIRRMPNTRAAHRLIEVAGEHDCQNTLVDRLFEAYFVNGQDIGDLQTLQQIAESAGLTSSTAVDALEDTSRDAGIEAYERNAQDKGVHGVPSFLFNDLMLFSGAQSPETIARSLQRAIDRGL